MITPRWHATIRAWSRRDYARRHWTVDENPGMASRGSTTYTIMARSLTTTGSPSCLPSRRRTVKWREELMERILALQKEDGSWANTNNRFWENDPVLATAYSLLALEYTLGMTR